jgi:hypothetical protein
MTTLFSVARIWMVKGPAFPVAQTVKLPLQAVASVPSVEENMDFSARGGA